MNIETYKILIPSLISVLGFVITIYMNKSNIKSELNKYYITKYMENYASIEYDIAEVLQLAIKYYLGSDEYEKLEYIIQKHRKGEFSETDDVDERLYRLGGYLSSYGSKESIAFLNNARKTYREYTKYEDKNSAEQKKSDFYKFAVILAALLLQIKQDIFKNGNYNCIDDELDWLCTRLPVDLYEKHEDTLKNELDEIF